MKKKPALFLDRDGVINHNVYYPDTDEWESPRSPDDFKLIEGSLEALTSLGKQYLLFIISNQPSFAKGKTTLENLQEIHERLMGNFKKEKILIQESFYCFHHPKGIGGSCICRKPSPYFIKKAIEHYPIDEQRSILIGDRDTDYLCASNAHIGFVGILPDHPNAHCSQYVSQIGIPNLLHFQSRCSLTQEF